MGNERHRKAVSSINRPRPLTKSGSELDACLLALELNTAHCEFRSHMHAFSLLDIFYTFDFPAELSFMSVVQCMVSK